MERIELCVNTKLGGNSVVDINKLLEKASTLGLKGIGVTDFEDVNSFHELEKNKGKYGNLKIIYGTTLQVVKDNISFQVKILAKNSAGIKSIYKLISLNEIKYHYRKMPFTKVINCQENLLLGFDISKLDIIELFSTYSPKEIKIFLNPYDFLIVTPNVDSEYLRRMLIICKKIKKRIVVSNDVRFINSTDKLSYAVLKRKNAKEIEDLHLMSTEELMDKFSYLSKEEIKEIVSTNSLAIANLVDDDINLMERNIEYDFDNDQKMTLRELVYTKANTIFNNEIPKMIKERLEDELALINKKNAFCFIASSEVIARSHELDYPTTTRGSLASSYIAYLLGLTSIDPVKYNIPYQTFLTNESNKILDFSFNIHKEVLPDLIKLLKQKYGSYNIVRCGINCVNSQATITKMVEDYQAKFKAKFSTEEMEAIFSNLYDVKRSNGKRAGGYFIIPPMYNYFDFMPVCKIDNELTTSINYRDVWQELAGIDLLMITPLEQLSDCKNNTSLETIPLDNQNVWHLFQEGKTDYITIFEGEKTREVLQLTKPTNLEELARVYGLMHGSGKYFQDIISSIKENNDINKIICFRDDIFEYLKNKGFTNNESYNIMNLVRKGKGSEVLDKFTDKNIEEIIKNIDFLYPKAQSLEYALLSYYMAYLKCYG